MSNHPPAGGAGPKDDGDSPIEPPVELESDELRFTGLPILRTWGALYAFVLGAFVVMVLLLTLFTRAFLRAWP